MSSQLGFKFVLAVLAIRYLPQLWVDFRSSKSRPICSAPSANMVSIFWSVLLLVFLISRPKLSFASGCGFCSIFFGAGIGTLALHTLGRSYHREIRISDDQRLVREGIYSTMRHPIRLGIACEAAGFLIAAQEWMATPVFLILLLLLRLRTKSEDALLRGAFGKVACEYQKNVSAVNPLPSVMALCRSYAVLLSKRARLRTASAGEAHIGSIPQGTADAESEP